MTKRQPWRRRIRAWAMERLPVRLQYQLENRALFREFKRQRAAAKTRREREAAQHGFWAEAELLRELRDEIEQRETAKLLKKARRHYIPAPSTEPKDGLWEDGPFGHSYLTQKGKRLLHRALREERRANRELTAFWVPWIGLVTGLVSALTALVLALKS